MHDYYRETNTTLAIHDVTISFLLCYGNQVHWTFSQHKLTASWCITAADQNNAAPTSRSQGWLILYSRD